MGVKTEANAGKRSFWEGLRALREATGEEWRKTKTEFNKGAGRTIKDMPRQRGRATRINVGPKNSGASKRWAPKVERTMANRAGNLYSRAAGMVSGGAGGTGDGGGLSRALGGATRFAGRWALPAAVVAEYARGANAGYDAGNKYEQVDEAARKGIRQYYGNDTANPDPWYLPSAAGRGGFQDQIVKDIDSVFGSDNPAIWDSYALRQTANKIRENEKNFDFAVGGYKVDPNTVLENRQSLPPGKVWVVGPDGKRRLADDQQFVKDQNGYDVLQQNPDNPVDVPHPMSLDNRMQDTTNGARIDLMRTTPDGTPDYANITSDAAGLRGVYRIDAPGAAPMFTDKVGESLGLVMPKDAQPLLKEDAKLLDTLSRAEMSQGQLDRMTTAEREAYDKKQAAKRADARAEEMDQIALENARSKQEYAKVKDGMEYLTNISNEKVAKRFAPVIARLEKVTPAHLKDMPALNRFAENLDKYRADPTASEFISELFRWDPSGTYGESFSVYDDLQRVAELYNAFGGGSNGEVVGVGGRTLTRSDMDEAGKNMLNSIENTLKRPGVRNLIEAATGIKLKSLNGVR